jgi:hypothetical protein
MLHGANGIFTCLIRMATSCRLRVRSNSLLEGAGTHPGREEVCEDTYASLAGGGCLRGGVPAGAAAEAIWDV